MLTQHRSPPTAHAAWPVHTPVPRTDALSSWKTLNFKSVLFTCFVIPILGVIYWIVNSQGIRVSLPIFAMRLHKLPIPGLSYLRKWQNLRDLDLAHVFALFMLVAVWSLSSTVWRLLLYGDAPSNRIDPVLYRRCLFSIAAPVIMCDLLMFWRGAADQAGLFGGGGLIPLAATIGYTGLLAFVSFRHVTLQDKGVSHEP